MGVHVGLEAAVEADVGPDQGRQTAPTGVGEPVSLAGACFSMVRQRPERGSARTSAGSSSQLLQRLPETAARLTGPQTLVRLPGSGGKIEEPGGQSLSAFSREKVLDDLVHQPGPPQAKIMRGHRV